MHNILSHEVNKEEFAPLGKDIINKILKSLHHYCIQLAGDVKSKVYYSGCRDYYIPAMPNLISEAISLTDKLEEKDRVDCLKTFLNECLKIFISCPYSGDLKSLSSIIKKLDEENRYHYAALTLEIVLIKLTNPKSFTDFHKLSDFDKSISWIDGLNKYYDVPNNKDFDWCRLEDSVFLIKNLDQNRKLLYAKRFLDFCIDQNYKLLCAKRGSWTQEDYFRETFNLIPLIDELDKESQLCYSKTILDIIKKLDNTDDIDDDDNLCFVNDEISSWYYIFHTLESAHLIKNIDQKDQFHYLNFMLKLFILDSAFISILEDQNDKMMASFISVFNTINQTDRNNCIGYIFNTSSEEKYGNKYHSEYFSPSDIIKNLTKLLEANRINNIKINIEYDFALTIQSNKTEQKNSNTEKEFPLALKKLIYELNFITGSKLKTLETECEIELNKFLTMTRKEFGYHAKEVTKEEILKDERFISILNEKLVVKAWEIDLHQIGATSGQCRQIFIYCFDDSLWLLENSNNIEQYSLSEIETSALKSAIVNRYTCEQNYNQFSALTEEQQSELNLLKDDVKTECRTIIDIAYHMNINDAYKLPNLLLNTLNLGKNNIKPSYANSGLRT